MHLRSAYDFYRCIVLGEEHKRSDIRAAIGSIKRYERGREVKKPPLPRNCKGNENREAVKSEE
jgi:hypothetical protein